MELIFDISRIAAGLLLAQAIFSKFGSLEDEFEKVAKWLSGFQGLIGGFVFISGVVYLLKWGCFFMDLSGVLAGLILFGHALVGVPGIGEYFGKASSYLKAFSYPIGLAALISGILGLLNLACF